MSRNNRAVNLPNLENMTSQPATTKRLTGACDHGSISSFTLGGGGGGDGGRDVVILPDGSTSHQSNSCLYYNSNYRTLSSF